MSSPFTLCKDVSPLMTTYRMPTLLCHNLCRCMHPALADSGILIDIMSSLSSLYLPLPLIILSCIMSVGSSKARSVIVSGIKLQLFDLAVSLHLTESWLIYK